VYHFADRLRGWDWGPILCPCGPWRPIRLEIFRSRISNLTIDYTLSSKLTSANGSIKAEVDGSIAGHVEFIIRKNKSIIFQQSARILPDHTSQVDFSIDAPELWFPHGYGRQELYEFEATPLQAQSELFGMTKRVGFRKAELVQSPDEIGKSFYFRVNGYDIFCGGSNWIPADSFTPRVSANKYRSWLQMMVDGYQTMIR
jgi:beta-mannosidase